MSKPWMPLYIADYLAKTAHLNAAQSGAYLHLIMHYWQSGGLPDNDESLARIARMTAGEWKRNRQVLEAFFRDGWKHGRIDEELAHAAEVSMKRRASAEQRHGKRPPNAPANGEERHPHAGASSQSQSLQNPEPAGSDAHAPVTTLDPRAILFRDGLPVLSILTDRPPDRLRPLIARWLKRTGDDAGALLLEIEKCRASPVADPIAWIEKQLKPREDRDGNGTDARRPHDVVFGALARVVEKRADRDRQRLDAAAVEDADGDGAERDQEPDQCPDIPPELRRIERLGARG